MMCRSSTNGFAAWSVVVGLYTIYVYIVSVAMQAALLKTSTNRVRVSNAFVSIMAFPGQIRMFFCLVFLVHDL